MRAPTLKAGKFGVKRRLGALEWGGHGCSENTGMFKDGESGALAGVVTGSKLFF